MTNQWKHLMNTANTYYSEQAWQSALSLYQKALALLESAFDEHLVQHPGNAIAAVIVTHLNLADTWQVLQKSEQACLQFEQANQFLHQLLKQPQLSDETRMAAMRSISRLDMEWAGCIRLHSRVLPEQHKQYYANARLSLEQLHYGALH